MKFGLDIGNSSVKGAALDDSNTLISQIGFPSAVNHVSDEKFLTFQKPEDFYIKVEKSALKHFDDIVAVGDKAMDLPDYQEFDVTSSSYKTNHPMTTSLLFGSIASQLHDETSLHIKLAVSIPIVETKTLGVVKEYENLLLGEHVFTVYREGETKQVTVVVDKVKVTNEGQAGFYGLLDTVDRPFRSALNSVYASLGEKEDPVGTLEDFLVCDIGEGTSDISVFRNKKFNPDYSFSVTQGIGSVLEASILNANREKLTIESRKDLQHVLASTNARQEKRRQQWEQYVTPEENAFIDKIVDTIVRAYGNRDFFDAIIFFGGGFSALTGYRIDMGTVVMSNNRLFTELKQRLADMNKDADLIFGVPKPYSQTINERGLTQVLTVM